MDATPRERDEDRYEPLRSGGASGLRGARTTPRVDPFLEAKLHWPPRRDDWVRRDGCSDQVERAVRHPVVLVAAPAGYGKTISLAQWLAGEERPPAAWVSLDAGDNDPNRLWTHVAAALTRAGCVLPALEATRWDGIATEAPGALLPAIVHALAAMPDDIVLVLDDFHFIQEPVCHDQVEFLVDRLPAQAHLVIVTRADPGLRLGASARPAVSPRSAPTT